MSKKRLFEEFLRRAKAHGFRPAGESPPEDGTQNRSVKNMRTRAVQYMLVSSGNTIRLEIRFGRGRFDDLNVNRIPYEQFRDFVPPQWDNDFTWKGPCSKGQNYTVGFGSWDVDIESQNSIQDSVGAAIENMERILPVLEDFFRTLPTD